MGYIRKYYNIPAKRGGKVKFKGNPGVIIGADGPYLRIRLDGEKAIHYYHPTYLIEYL